MDVANSLAWQTVILPTAPENLTKSLEMVERAAAADRENIYYESTRASVYYRVGEFEKAVAALSKVLRFTDQTITARQPVVLSAKRNLAWNGLFFAMALHQAGQTEESRTWLVKATSAIQDLTREKVDDGSPNIDRTAWYDRVELELLQREANELIGGDRREVRP